MFNDESFVKEFCEKVVSLKVKSVFEIGCKSWELLRDLQILGLECSGLDIEPENDFAFKGDIRTFKSKKKFELVFSSGVLEHFTIEELPEIIDKMAQISNKYILNIVPNSGCTSYMNCKSNTTAEWKDELDFNIETLSELHKKAGLEVVESGYMGSEWARKFGSEVSEPYLVWVLCKKT